MVKSPALRASRIPKIDLYDPSLVLYAPLWRPDMVAIGGSIESGTGTMAVTPFNLSVGVQTLTALTAGTFIVTIPYGGSVASGTATITGSPVTISAGVATSVTTGVTTGTFTVTPSNIIRSKDSTGHLCTVTGATWTSQGRNFDGNDDHLTLLAASNIITGTNDWTLSEWIKPDTNPAVAIMGMEWLSAAGTNPIYLLVGVVATMRCAAYLPGETLLVADVANAIDIGVWQYFSIAKSGNNYSLRKNGVEISTGTLTVNFGTPTTLYFIGNDDFTPHTQGFDGLIGELKLYNRGLSSVEDMRLYQATKWRYL